jgi:hypothetical protein
MRGRTIHHVYAEDERPAESHEYPPPQRTWRFPRQSRVVATAMLCAAVAFVAALAMHAGPGSGAKSPHSAVVQTGSRLAEGAPVRPVGRAARRSVRRRQPPLRRTTGRRQLPSSALTEEAHAVASSSTAAGATHVAVARAALPEFTFER